MKIELIITTSALCVFTLYFVVLVGARLRFYMRWNQKKKTKKYQKPEESVLEEARPVIGNLQNDAGPNEKHPMVAFNMLCFTLLLTVLLRCVVYVALVALPFPPSQRGCDLMFELVHLLYGFGLVLFYAFVWKMQRHFYYMKEFRKFYTTYVQRWSWSAAACMALISSGRLMILMAGWRFGVQFLPNEEVGCLIDFFGRIKPRNVTETEWNLPFTYNISCGLILLCITGGLPINLCIKSISLKDPEGSLPDKTLSAVKKKLLLVTISSALALASTVISQLVMWGLLSSSLPAILFNQIDDLATVVQVVGMVFGMENWKFYLLPCTCCCKRSQDDRPAFTSNRAID